MLMSPNADDLAKIVVEEGVKIVTTGAGNPGKYMESWKAAGIKVFPSWLLWPWQNGWSGPVQMASSQKAASPADISVPLRQCVWCLR